MDFENPEISRELALLIQDVPFEQRATFRAFAQKASSMEVFKKMIADGFFGSTAAL